MVGLKRCLNNYEQRMAESATRLKEVLKRYAIL